MHSKYCSFLDLHISVLHGKLRTNFFEKNDDYSFLMVIINNLSSALMNVIRCKPLWLQELISLVVKSFQEQVISFETVRVVSSNYRNMKVNNNITVIQILYSKQK